MKEVEPEPLLPPLREDLRIFEAAPEVDGSPAWMIQDPVINRFYRIGWLEFECLLRWGETASKVAAAVANTTPLQPDSIQVLALVDFLQQHQLLRLDREGTDRLVARSASSGWLSWRWWLHHYLFIRIPLVHPQVFLTRASQFLSPFFQPFMLWLIGILSLFGLILIYRQWDVFVQSVVESISPQGLAGFAIAIILAKTTHELGHALVATHFGVRVAHMGIAFVVLWPMLYTDTGESWKLRSRRQRLAISAAGILVELGLAGLATLGWVFSEPGWINTACLYLATTGWTLTLALNLSPFMRFDGYFILSDLLDFPNLHERSSALARVKLRRTILGLDEPWPEQFPSRQRNLLITFALAIWIYRLVVFTGIAVAVYLFFFKILGIFLFMVEITWFVAFPIWRELKIWWGRRIEVPKKRYQLLCIFLVLSMLAVTIPWRTDVRGAGVAHATKQTTIFAPYSSVITFLRPIGEVASGETLAQLDAPDVRAQGLLNQARVEALSAQLTSLQVQEHGLDQAGATSRRLREQLAEVQAASEELGRLNLRAEYTGIWLDIDPQMQDGTWVNSHEQLGVLVDPKHWQVDAYVGQADVERLSPGSHAVFYPEHALHTLIGKVIDIDTTRAQHLNHPMLSTHFGGPIAVTAQANDLIPTEAQFRVRIELEAAPETLRETRGEILIEGQRRSLFIGSLRNFIAICIRESGF